MGKKILLADDSITIQKVIELTFSDEDFEVVTVGNGRLAVEKAQEVRPDIVLCDIIMPEKDGYEVCDFIKKHPALGHVPVLLLTGAFEPFDQERAARVGCDGFLAKPFEPQTLIAKVKDLLSQAASRQAAPSIRPAAPPPPAPPVQVAPPPPPRPAPAVAPLAPTAPAFAPPPVPEPPPFLPEEPVLEEAAMGFGEVAEPASEPTLVPTFEDASTLEPGPFGEAESFGEAPDDLVPVSPEEQETLSAPPRLDDSSTVMFQAVPPPEPEWAQPEMEVPPTMEVPLEARAQASAASAGVFEEVFEEEAGALPPVAEPASSVLAPPPTPVAAAHVVSRPPIPEPPPPPPMPPEELEEASFAEVGVSEPAPAASPSVAAEVGVPADQVAQIAQRVVAQISERVVREVAWEVIPDLAEALIKKEIERLKAELQQG